MLSVTVRPPPFATAWTGEGHAARGVPIHSFQRFRETGGNPARRVPNRQCTHRPRYGRENGVTDLSLLGSDPRDLPPQWKDRPPTLPPPPSPLPVPSYPPVPRFSLPSPSPPDSLKTIAVVSLNERLARRAFSFLLRGRTHAILRQPLKSFEC